MGGIGGILTGALALAALETVISSDRATTGVAALLQMPGAWARAFMDPGKPLLPNFAKAPCAEHGDTSLFSFLTSAYQPAGQSPITAIPNPSTLPSPTTPAPSSPPTTISV